jgi:hypothetical protein
MKNAKDWLKELEDLYEGQKTGRIKPVQAVEMNNTIGKVISLTKLQLENQKLQGSLGDKAPRVPMLDEPKE